MPLKFSLPAMIAQRLRIAGAGPVGDEFVLGEMPNGLLNPRPLPKGRGLGRGLPGRGRGFIKGPIRIPEHI